MKDTRGSSPRSTLQQGQYKHQHHLCPNQLPNIYRSNAFCNYKYGVLNMTEALDGPFIINLTMPELLPPQMYCTDGNVNGVIGTCYGDSGGPHIKKYVWKGVDYFKLR